MEKRKSLQKVSFTFMTAFGLLTVMVIFGCKVNASPALSQPCIVTQPSGQTFAVTQYGDEYFSYHVTSSGDIVMLDEDGYWHYTIAENFTYENALATNLVADSARYMVDEPLADALEEADLETLPNLTYKRDTVQEALLSTAALTGENLQADTQYKYLGTQPVLVLLVEFDDMAIQYEADWHDQIFGTNQKSVKHYYDEVSNGLINLVPAAESYGIENDGIVKVKLSRNHPNPKKDNSSVSKEIAAYALWSADPYVDFSAFDTNNNGKIDNYELHIITVIAGYEKSMNGDNRVSVWGHKGSVTQPLDGKVSTTYTQFGEVHKSITYGGPDHQATIGIICHELGHDMGLPDLYDVYTNDPSVGIYSLMATGSNNKLQLPGEEAGETPAHLDAYCKVQLGIVAPTVIEENTVWDGMVYSFNQADNYNILKIPCKNEWEYFLIENRQNNKEENGETVNNGYDAAIPSIEKGGLAVYYINEKYDFNEEKGARLVTILEKSNYRGAPIYRYYIGEFMGVQQKTILDRTTSPSTQVEDGSYAWFAFECKSANSSAMDVKIQPDVKFDFMYYPYYSPNCAQGRTYMLASELINTTNQTLVWESEDPSIATVDASGKVTGISEGNTKVTVTTLDGKYTASATIYIVPAVSAVMKMNTNKAVLNNSLITASDFIYINNKAMISTDSLQTLLGAHVTETPFGYEIIMNNNAILIYNNSTTWKVSTHNRLLISIEVSMPVQIVNEKVYLAVRDVCTCSELNLRYISDLSGEYLIITNYFDTDIAYFNTLLESAKPYFDDYGDTLDTAHPWGFSPIGVKILNGNLEYAEDVDVVRFTAPMTGTYTIESINSAPDMKAWFYESIVQIAEDDNSGENSNFKIIVSLTEGQTYYLKLSQGSQGGVGTYTIQFIMDDYGNTFTTAYEITLAEGANTIGGYINFTDDVDMFKFTAPATGTYMFQTSPVSFHTVTIYDASMQTVVACPSSRGMAGYIVLFEQELTQGQTYYLMIDKASQYQINITVPN